MFAAAGSFAQTPATAGGQPAVEKSLTSTYTETAKKIDRMMAAYDAVNGKLDRSQFEIDALAARLGSDPRAIFHFVRDEIRYEPYYGVLRGALGTLLCRSGNSLDRSLLLAALLQKAGINGQIAAGKLNDKAAYVLVGRLFEAVHTVPSSVPPIAELRPGISAALGMQPGNFQQIVDQTNQKSESAKKQILDYVNSETGSLSKTLATAGVDMGVLTAASELVAEAREHYWVRYQDADGKWVDLDPAFADAQPGKAMTTVDDSFAPDAVPEELYHHLRLTVTLRIAQVDGATDGSTNDTVLIDKELRIADQQGVDITLANQPVPMPRLTKPGIKLNDALAAVKGYQLALQIGDQSINGQYFDLDGNISDSPPSATPDAGGMGAAVGGVGGGLLGGFGGGGSAPPPGSTRIVGEWVNYQLTSPGPRGGQPIVHSYQRDIVAPVTVKMWSAASGAQSTPTHLGKDVLRRRLQWITELMPVSGAIVVDYPDYLAMQAVAMGRPQIDWMLKTVYRQPPSAQGPSIKYPIAELFLATQAMQLENNLGSSWFPAVKSYLGRPGLIAYETTVSKEPDASTFSRGYDIVAFSSRAVGNPASVPAAVRQQAASLHLLHGVLATRLEWALLATPSGASPAGTMERPVLNATRVLTAARERGVREVVLRPGTANLDQLAATSVPAAVKAEISASLAMGYMVALPASPVDLDGRPQIAWWRLDPKSGEVIGVMPGGRGQADEEFVNVLIAVALSEYICIYDYSNSSKGTNAFAQLLACSATGVVLGGLNIMGAELYSINDAITAALFHYHEFGGAEK
jgi:hypothetical protein